MRRKYCVECQRPLKKDEIGLSRKLVGDEESDLFCIDCLSAYLDCEVADLKSKIQEFKEQGCTLFL